MAAQNLHTVCVSVAATTVEEALTCATLAQESADVIEIRLDFLDVPAVKPFIDKLNKPLLFTNRPEWEGGNYKGSEQSRVDLLLEAIDAGAAYIDLELKAGMEIRKQLLAAAKNSKTQVIISWHDFKATASRTALESIFQEQYRSGADIGKIVTMARNIEDVLRVLNLQTLAKEMDFPLIAFCMGRAGMISRVATLELGGLMTYAAPDSGTATAPGQLPASFIKNFFNALPVHD